MVAFKKLIHFVPTENLTVAGKTRLLKINNSVILVIVLTSNIFLAYFTYAFFIAY